MLAIALEYKKLYGRKCIKPIYENRNLLAYRKTFDPLRKWRCTTPFLKEPHARKACQNCASDLKSEITLHLSHSCSLDVAIKVIWPRSAMRCLLQNPVIIVPVLQVINCNYSAKRGMSIITLFVRDRARPASRINSDLGKFLVPVSISVVVLENFQVT